VALDADPIAALRHERWYKADCMSDVKDRLESVFRSVFADPLLKINEGMTADDIEEWDSVTHVTLLVHIEQKFGVQFRTGEVMTIANVGDLIALLENKVR
jgi:acyl carrier protein